MTCGIHTESHIIHHIFGPTGQRLELAKLQYLSLVSTQLFFYRQNNLIILGFNDSHIIQHVGLHVR